MVPKAEDTGHHSFNLLLVTNHHSFYLTNII